MTHWWIRINVGPRDRARGWSVLKLLHSSRKLIRLESEEMLTRGGFYQKPHISSSCCQPLLILAVLVSYSCVTNYHKFSGLKQVSYLKVLERNLKQILQNQNKICISSGGSKGKSICCLFQHLEAACTLWFLATLSWPLLPLLQIFLGHSCLRLLVIRTIKRSRKISLAAKSLSPCKV